jgi:predicted kinase
MTEATRPHRCAVIDRAGWPEFVRTLWEDSLTELREHGHRVVDGAVLDRVARRALAYLSGRDPLLCRRIAEVHLVAGYGDQPARDRAEPDPEHPASLAHLYVAYQAVVGTRTACRQHRRTGDPAAADQARLLLDLADRHLAAGRLRLVLVGGLPATGKTTVAAQLGDHYGWPVLHSDQTRTRLTGHLGEPRPGPPGAGADRPRWTAVTYAALLEDAGRYLEAGESVILDASWSDPAHRAAAARLARSACADLVELCCAAPEPIALRRLADRSGTGGSGSDADAAAYRQLAAPAGPWPAAATLDTSAARRHPDPAALAAIDTL